MGTGVGLVLIVDSKLPPFGRAPLKARWRHAVALLSALILDYHAAPLAGGYRARGVDRRIADFLRLHAIRNRVAGLHVIDCAVAHFIHPRIGLIAVLTARERLGPQSHWHHSQ